MSVHRVNGIPEYLLTTEEAAGLAGNAQPAPSAQPAAGPALPPPLPPPPAPSAQPEPQVQQAWKLEGASLIGRGHVMCKENNQDSFLVWNGPNYQLAIAADGCSGAENSEVGAQLGTKFLAKAIDTAMQFYGSVARLDWSKISKTYLGQVSRTAQDCIDPRVAARMFLNTFVVAVVDEHQASFVMCGDGVVAVNGSVVAEYDYDNVPPFLAYNLFKGNWRERYKPEETVLHVVHSLPTEQLRSFCVCTDGAQKLKPESRQVLAGAFRKLPARLDYRRLRQGAYR